MTRRELSRIGKKLYGTEWQSKLARALGRDARTVRRWKSGESPIPKVAENRIRSLAAESAE